MPLSITYLQQITDRVIKLTNSIFTNFNLSLLRKWEYSYKKINNKGSCVYIKRTKADND